ncbi:MAG: outer membrane beta-barrel domain-containing protein, partial [Bdellovibrionaceae bacterium]|nr:outer membrane beta-barrel domain-containing protein [Pseudobdellovibrionaceae bacterium]
ADSFGFPKNYFGLDAKYTPFYGKMSWMNKKIIPFEHYFTAGLGNTTVSTGGSGATFHVGTGQNFALSKRFAVNWDFSMMAYSAKSTDGTVQSFNDLMLTVGMSFFYPEATYR